MPSVDLDSSSDDGNEYTTTNVTLGYASSDPTGDDISRIGGYPTWLDGIVVPPATLAKCKVCGGLTSSLLQLNADLRQHFPNDDRRLHVLCCRKKACSKKPGSVRAFREVQKPATRDRKSHRQSDDNSASKALPSNDLGSTLFGRETKNSTSTRANPFSTSEDSKVEQGNPFASLPPTNTLAAMPPQMPVQESEPPAESFADKLKISDSKEPRTQLETEKWPEQPSFPPPFRILYLDADTEELEPEPITSSTSGPSKTEYDAEDSSSNALDKGNFESELDKTFQKFSDRTAQNPEQVLRYEFKGQPLLYSGTDDVASRFIVPFGKAGAPRGMPRCDTCGAQRVFEMQLMPGLIYELEKEESLDLDDGMEWGSIIVGTCANNCGDAGEISFREEWVGVQWEERVVRK